MPRRDEFTSQQIRIALDQSAASVRRNWPGEFAGKPVHYICEECAFVSDQRSHFEVDHVVPCARGGTKNVMSDATLAAISAGHVAPLFEAGVNERVLCVGCNQAKKERQFVPPGAGYAYRFPEWDRNPDHIYGGAPKVSPLEIEQHPEPYDPARYRRH
ncbi:MAG TPA: hypothetical protein VJN43_00165 [Bryobacteraceae bacterium]|nr:hypothetical protein [Bryobacteraceae bacterium]